MNNNFFSPLELFEINPIVSASIFYLSSSFEIVSLLAFLSFFILISSNMIIGIKNNNALYIFNFIYNFLINIFKENLKSTRAQKYFPLIFILFVIIFIFNITGLIFYDVSITSHLYFTLFLSNSFFLLFFFTAIINYDINYVFKFIENDINIFLKIILFFIELISFIIRPFSLGIRLFTNMLSGHVLLHIFIDFFSYICKNFFFLLLIPAIIIFLVFLLEIFIAFIQTYVFIILLIIYLKDMYILHDDKK